MKKLVFLIVVLVLIIFIIGFIVKNKNKSEIIYNTTYYLSSGSLRIRIYANGDVYDDWEIEEPNHKVNYKFVKTLSNEELNSLKEQLANSENKDTLKQFVRQLVYGNKSFGKPSIEFKDNEIGG